MDSYYTSAELADTLVSLATSRRRPAVIGDFACGEGSLLLAAERRWPEALMVANDVSSRALASVRRIRPNWSVACADFLNPRSTRSSALRTHLRCMDIVLLNPPFSKKDRRTHAVYVAGEQFLVSVATAFVVNSLPYLRPDGTVLAVLPDGCLVSLQDAAAWKALEQELRIEVIRDNSRSAFRGVRARTCLVRLTRQARSVSAASSPVGIEAASRLLEVDRGICQMHSRQKTVAGLGAPLAHTSHLKMGAVIHSGEHVQGRSFQGPGLLFPRVGLVTPDKLCVLETSRRVVLSDCVLAVRCASELEARSLRDRVIASWPDFAAAYRGTGAPYITVKGAATLLTALSGISAARSSSAVSRYQEDTLAPDEPKR